MTRRLVPLALVAGVLLGCSSTVDPGPGTYTGAAGGSTTASTAPTETTEPTETGDTTEPSQSEDPADRAAAEQAGAAFADLVNTGDLVAAYDLLCAADRAEVTVEDFGEEAPPNGSFTLVVTGQVQPGAFIADVSYADGTDTESGEVYILEESGAWCLSQNVP